MLILVSGSIHKLPGNACNHSILNRQCAVEIVMNAGDLECFVIRHRGIIRDNLFVLIVIVPDRTLLRPVMKVHDVVFDPVNLEAAQGIWQGR
jgi:hypothetical protein